MWSRDGDRFVGDPDELRALLTSTAAPADLHILPWDGEPFTVDFGDRGSLDAAAAELSDRVAAVEAEDPWVKQTFGISGLGEGLVLYPLAVDGAPAPANPEAIGALMFKAKGEKHRTVGAKVAVSVDPAVAASAEELVSMMLTEARLQQGLAAVGDQSPKSTGAFLAWIVADVRKASAPGMKTNCSGLRGSASSGYRRTARKSTRAASSRQTPTR